MLFVGVLVIPLAMTVMLSFHDWGQYKGIEPVFILKNWREIATDPYYAEMFWRTFRIALLTTLITALLGAPECAGFQLPTNPSLLRGQRQRRNVESKELLVIYC